MRSFQSFVEAELRAVVKTHVGVTEQAAGRLPQGAGVHSAQLLLRQAEVAPHLRTGLHLGDVEAVLSTWFRRCREMGSITEFDFDICSLSVSATEFVLLPSRSAILSKNSQSVERGPYLTKLT